MSVLDHSMLWWLVGGGVGALLAKKHRVVGFALGALVLGSVTDVVAARGISETRNEMEHALRSPVR